ncbi:MAG TPA: hypothetical protein ENJ99_03150 [Rhizobiales bacterium]|nr:hypothetical protein [Hyphomicrobiales bacterium]
MENTSVHTAVSFYFDGQFLKRFRTFSLVAGGLLMLAGIAGAVVPQIMSLVVSAFLGWLLIAAGIISGYFAFLSRGRSMIALLKPVLLILTGAMFLFYPLAGVAALALLLTVYLLLDAFGSLGLAYDIYPHRGWGWMTFNGLISLLLAVFMIFAWPVGSPVLVGIYIGISLFFDGLALFTLGLFSTAASRS